MSKNELIEKAVLKFNGEWPTNKFEFVDTSRWEQAIIYCIRPDLESKEGEIIHATEIHCGGTGFDPHHYELICTCEEFSAAADRMRGKPDWKDAPEWAQWLAQNNAGDWWWYPAGESPELIGSCFANNSDEACAIRAIEGVVLGDWRNTLEKRSEQKVETVGDKSWVDLGILPPPGTMVEIVGEGLVYGHGETGEVVGCFVPPEGKCLHSVAIVNMSYGMGCFSRANLKPIKTDKEKAIEAAIEAMQPNSLTGTMTLWFGKLYDAGLLRLPNQK